MDFIALSGRLGSVAMFVIAALVGAALLAQPPPVWNWRYRLVGGGTIALMVLQLFGGMALIGWGALLRGPRE